jgi:hydrogenase maturation protease
MSATLVLGAGNVLMRDEGVGVRAAELLRDRAPSGVRVVAEGPIGPSTVTHVEGVTHLLVLDAVDAGLEPGTVVRREPTPGGRSGPPGGGLSPHEFGVRDLLVLLEQTGSAPDRVVLLGVQPAAVEPGTDLSRNVEASLPRLVAAALDVLAGWG